MNFSIRFVFLLLAVILFALAACNVPARGANLTAAGLLMLALGLLITV